MIKGGQLVAFFLSADSGQYMLKSEQLGRSQPLHQGLSETVNQFGTEQVALLVPRHLASQAAIRALSRDRKAILGLRSFTPPQLIRSINFTGSSPQLINDQVADEIIRHLARQYSDDQFFRLISKTSALSAVLKTFRSLKSAELDSGSLSSLADPNLNKICALLRDFDDFCQANNLAERWTYELQAINGLKENPLPGTKAIWVAQFPSFEPRYLQLLKYLSQFMEVHFSLAAGGIAFEQINSLEQKFGIIHPYSTYTQSSDLSEFQSNFATANISPISKKPDVQFLAANSRYDEVETVGRKVQDLIHAGVPLEQIGVTMTNISAYDQFIRNVFNHLDIPYHYRRGIPLLQSPLVRIVLKIVRLADHPLPYPTLLSILTSRFFPFAEKSEWKKLLVKSGIFKAYLKDWPEKLEAWRDLQPDEFKEYKGEKLLKQLRQFIVIVSDNSPRQIIEHVIEKYLKPSLLELSKHEKSIFSKHLEELQNIVDSATETANSCQAVGIAKADTAWEILQEAMSQATITEDQPVGSAVAVMNIFDIGYTSVDHLFVIGMDEHSLSSFTNSSDQLLNEQQLATLAEIALHPAAIKLPGHYRAETEQALKLAIASARKSICFLNPLFSSDAKEFSPSHYLESAMQLCGVEKAEEVFGGDLRKLQDLPLEKSALRRQVAKLAFQPEHNNEESLHFLHAAAQKESQCLDLLFAQRQIEEQRLSALHSKPENRWAASNQFSGRITDSKLLAKLSASLQPPERQWSYHTLSPLLACPFQFFLESLLKLKEHKLPNEKLDPLKLGILHHEIFREFVEPNIGKYPLGDLPALQQSMVRIVAGKFSENFGGDGFEQWSSSIKLQYLQTLELMQQFVAAEAELDSRQPVEVEKAFGQGSDLSVKFIGEESEIFFRGRFDRLDRLDNGELMVIDYKASNSQVPKLKRPPYESSLQLPLYILAAAAAFEQPTSSVCAVIQSMKGLEKLAILETTNSNFEPLFRQNEELDHYQLPIYLPYRIEEMIKRAEAGELPITLIHKERFYNHVNLVARWLELPPEMAGVE
jgi:ATP-dependent helicase/DNAse subunit B